MSFNPGTAVYRVKFYHPESRLNGSVEVIASSGVKAEVIALERFFPVARDPDVLPRVAGWEVTSTEKLRSIDKHFEEESYLG